MNRYYVLQFKPHHWENKWVTQSKRYETLEEAQRELAKRDRHMYRIAEAYTVTRYKPV